MLKKLQRAIGLGTLLVFLAQPSFGQDVVAYPKKGQSTKQQEKDKYDCFEWAKKQTGYDPTQAASSSTGTQAPGQQPGGAVRGAAKGAGVGAIGGAIGGDAGKGAGIGAGVGAVGGAGRRRQAEKAEQQEQQQMAGQQEQKGAAFKKAESACLEGRGYSVS